MSESEIKHIMVPMQCVGPDRFEGDLRQDGRTAHITVTDQYVARISLWMPQGFGKNPCGGGAMMRLAKDGTWSGEAEDIVGDRRWLVSGRLEEGNCELLFSAAGKPLKMRKPVRKPAGKAAQA